MSIRLTPDEAWTFIEAAHTGILTTLRADGSPITLPTWFVVDDRTICFRTYRGTKKIARITKDPRVAFLVEAGERWADLRAVHVSGVVTRIDGEAECAAIDRAIDAKYAAFVTARTDMPEQTRQAYAAKRFYRLVPGPRLLTWDNRRIDLKPS